MPGLPRIEPRAAIEDAAALRLGDADAVVLDQDLDEAGLRADRHEHAAAAIFGGILDQIAEHLVEILPLDMRPAASLSPVDVDADIGDRAARPRARPLRGSARHRRGCAPMPRRPTARARARWWSTWRRIVRASRITVCAEIVGLRGRGVHDHGERRLERMGEIAGVAARLLGLALVMLEQRVELLDHRRDFDRASRRSTRRRLARAHPRDLLRAPGAAATARRRSAAPPSRSARAPSSSEAADQRAAQRVDLRVEPVAALRDLETPAHRRSRQHHVALERCAASRRGTASLS